MKIYYSLSIPHFLYEILLAIRSQACRRFQQNLSFEITPIACCSVSSLEPSSHLFPVGSCEATAAAQRFKKQLHGTERYVSAAGTASDSEYNENEQGELELVCTH